MGIDELKGKTYTVAVMETFTLNEELLNNYKEYMDDYPHTTESLTEFLADLMVPVQDRSETSHLVISENKKENN
jgi:hypothetical protein